MIFDKKSENLNIPKPTSTISVIEFYKGRNVLITGGTGFMGKVLIEKLLWACEDIGNIYLLVRSKKGCHPKKRIEDILELPVFDRIRERNPNIFSKLVPIIGDIWEENLGIGDVDRKLLESTVSIIFHAASSVRFDDSLHKAILLNVRGTKYIVDLAKKMKNLKVCVYVSTSYSNCDKNIIEERVYPTDVDWRVIIKAAEVIDENVLNVLSPKILKNRPNTYVLTKFFAENIINDYSTTLPLIIVRPSIVSNCIQEPTPGWVDTLNGPTGLVAGFASGVLHCMYGDGNCKTDYNPCDRVINALVVTAWYRGISESMKCHVINAALGGKKKTSINYMSTHLDDSLDVAPLSQALWYPAYIMTTNKYIYYFMLIFTHLLPAFLIDSLRFMRKDNFSLLRLYRKIHIASFALAYFTCREWKIITENYDLLSKYTPNEEKKIFKINVEDVVEREALMISFIGLKKFIFKDDMNEESIKAAKKQNLRLYWLHLMTKIFLIFISLWFLLKLITKYCLPLLTDAILAIN